MRPNLKIGVANNDESELGNNSDHEQIVMALRKTMQKEVEVMVIRTVQQVIRPIVEDLIRKVVKEEIQSAQEKFLTSQNQNSMDKTTTLRPRCLELKFLDEVSDLVLTGKEIKGKEGKHVRVALYDNETGLVADSGCEASAKVEILVLEAGPNDNVQDWSHNDFNNSIVRENDKTRPHFPKSVFVYLENGIGILSNVRLGHVSRWMKSCQCRLGARVVDNLDGSRAKEARTESFTVRDSRCKLYKKHHPPSLSDDVWRLENIAKDGARCNSLNKENIFTVEDLLFLHSIDPQRLQKTLAAGAKAWWKVTVDHARECINNDKKIQLYYSSSECKTGVVFDVVGKLKGVIRNNHYVPIERVPKAEKAEAQKLLASTFDNRKDIISFDDETSFTSFLRQSSYISDDNNGTNSCGLDIPDDCPQSTIENIDRNYPTGLGTSSQGMNPSIEFSGHSNSLCLPGSLISENTEYSNQQIFGDPDIEHLLGNFGDNEDFISLIINNNGKHSEIPRVESHSDRQSTTGRISFVGVAMTVRWLFSPREKVASVGVRQLQKRQRRH